MVTIPKGFGATACSDATPNLASVLTEISDELTTLANSLTEISTELTALADTVLTGGGGGGSLPVAPPILGAVLTLNDEEGTADWRPKYSAAYIGFGTDEFPYVAPPLGEEPTITAPPFANPYHVNITFIPEVDFVFPVAAGSFEDQTIVFHRHAEAGAFSIGILAAGTPPLPLTLPPGNTGGNVGSDDGQDSIRWNGTAWEESGSIPVVEATIFARVAILESLPAAITELQARPVGAAPLVLETIHASDGGPLSLPNGLGAGTSIFVPVQPDEADPPARVILIPGDALDQLVVVQMNDGDATGGTLVITSPVGAFGWTPKTIAVDGNSATFRWRGLARGWVLLTDPPADAIPDATDEASAVTAVNALLALARAKGDILA